jgi:phage repressor protein C with HTH and peptisase S24 domain
MGLVAKRLEVIPMSEPPKVRIISDNHQYSAYEGTADEVHIIGRVRWYGYGREM